MLGLAESSIRILISCVGQSRSLTVRTNLLFEHKKTANQSLLKLWWWWELLRGTEFELQHQQEPTVGRQIYLNRSISNSISSTQYHNKQGPEWRERTKRHPRDSTGPGALHGSNKCAHSLNFLPEPCWSQTMPSGSIQEASGCTLGIWLRGKHAKLTVALGDLAGVFQPWWFCVSVTCACRKSIHKTSDFCN